MIRYGLAALALKAFSMNDATRRAYRWIGNRFGASSRQMRDLASDTQRGKLLVELYRKHTAPRPRDRVLELGTGWMHWYGVYLRLFFDVRVTALDVWDNRQFTAFKACFSRLRQRFKKESVPAPVAALLDRIAAARDFDEVYRLLGFDYVIVPDGSLVQFPDASFASIFSMHVLEHVLRDSVPALARHMYRTLQPGSVSIHQIGIDDHLSLYDPAASRKQYVSYSDAVWSALFENEVQYFNRLQAPDWIATFEQAGFVLLERQAETTSLAGLKISPAFTRYAKDDLACTTLTLVLWRP
jgi:SAM-dependent methyltransferase